MGGMKARGATSVQQNQLHIKQQLQQNPDSHVENPVHVLKLSFCTRVLTEKDILGIKIYFGKWFVQRIQNKLFHYKC